MNPDPRWKETGISLAHQAGELMRKGLNERVERHVKPDLTDVTAVDLAISALVQETIGREFPTHGLIEEESGMHGDGKEYQWVCDPLDGTVPFANGIPTSCFSIALVRDGQSIMGIAYDPYLDRMFHASVGEGATLNGKPIRVSSHEDWKGTHFGMCIGGIIEEYDLSDILHVLNRRKIAGTYLGSSIYAAMMVACGRIPSAVYPSLKPWDSAAVKVIVEEAGGKVTDLFGKEQRYDGRTNGVLVSNGKVHTQVIEIVRECLDGSAQRAS